MVGSYDWLIYTCCNPKVLKCHPRCNNKGVIVYKDQDTTVVLKEW